MYHFWSIILYGRQKVVKNLILFYIPEENRLQFKWPCLSTFGKCMLKMYFSSTKEQCPQIRAHAR